MRRGSITNFASMVEKSAAFKAGEKPGPWPRVFSLRHEKTHSSDPNFAQVATVEKETNFHK